MPGAELTVCAKPVSTMFMSPVNTQCLRQRAVAHFPLDLQGEGAGPLSSCLVESQGSRSATMQARETVGCRVGAGSGRGTLWTPSGRVRAIASGVIVGMVASVSAAGFRSHRRERVRQEEAGAGKGQLCLHTTWPAVSNCHIPATV